MNINNTLIDIDNLVIYDLRADIPSKLAFELELGISANFVIFPSLYDMHNEQYIASTLDINPVSDLVEQLQYACENDAELDRLREYVELNILDLDLTYKESCKARYESLGIE